MGSGSQEHVQKGIFPFSAPSPSKVIMGAHCWYLIFLRDCQRKLELDGKVVKADFFFRNYIPIGQKRPQFRTGLNFKVCSKLGILKIEDQCSLNLLFSKGIQVLLLAANSGRRW